MAVRLVCILMLFPSASAATGTQHNPNPYKIGQTFMANSIDPLDGSAGWALVSHGIAEKLYTVNNKGVIVPQIAQSNSKIDTLNWEVTLKTDYKFSDGTLVTATLVADALNLLNTKNSKNAQASVGKIVVTTAGTNKVKIQTERATPVIESVLAEWVFTIFLQKSGAYLFTGPYAVETFVKGKNIDLITNTHYPRASERPLVRIVKYASGQALAAALSKNEVDMAFHLPVGELEALRKISGITIKTFSVEYMYMMWHNIRRSPLSDKNVRKAVDIALDRSQLTQTLLGGAGTRSFFPPNTPYHVKDSELGQLNADKSGAEKLLTDAGWILNGGKRMKNGTALTLKLVAYPQRPGLVTVQPVIATTLEAIGITVNQVVTSGANWDELDKIMADKDYDLLCWAQNTLPAGDPQSFTNWFRTGAGNNHAGLASNNIDNLLDKLSNAASGDPRITASANAQKAILELVPISMWMAPAWHVGLSNRMANYQPWGSDYYIIHDFLFLGELSMTTTTAAKENDASNSYRAMVNAFLVTSLWFIHSKFGV